MNTFLWALIIYTDIVEVYVPMTLLEKSDD